MLPEKMLYFSAREDRGGGGGGWEVSLVRWVEWCDWAVPSPTAAADQIPLQASATITPGTWSQHPLQWMQRAWSGAR